MERRSDVRNDCGLNVEHSAYHFCGAINHRHGMKNYVWRHQRCIPERKKKKKLWIGDEIGVTQLKDDKDTWLKIGF